MKYSRKMVWHSEDDIDQTSQQISIPKTVKENKKRIERDMDKFHKLLNIVLRIAIHKGYNEDFSLNDDNGKRIPNSNVVAHLNNALSPGKLLIGETDFIRLLYNSKIDPKWIVNENIRAKLLAFMDNSQPTDVTTMEIQESPIVNYKTNQQNIPEYSKNNLSSAKKRQLSSEDEDEPQMTTIETHKKKKQKVMPKLIPYWEVPVPSSDGDEEI